MLARSRPRNSLPRFSTIAKPGGGVAEYPLGGLAFSRGSAGSLLVSLLRRLKTMASAYPMIPSVHAMISTARDTQLKVSQTDRSSILREFASKQDSIQTLAAR